MSLLPPQHQRVGAHRARRNPFAVTVTAASAAVVLTGLLIWGVTAGRGGDASTIADGSGGTATTATVGAADPSVTDPAASGGVVVTDPLASPSTTAAAPTTTAPTVDRAVTVAVLNGGYNVPGKAKSTAEALIAAGWAGVDTTLTTNHEDFPDIATTQILYGDASLAATAQQLAADLGCGVATQVDMTAEGYTTQVVVLMGADFVEPS